MKKALSIMILSFVIMLSLVSCGGISKDKAVDIALKSIGTSKVYVQKWEVVLDDSASPSVYRVTTWRDGKYVISVDSKTGDVISTEFTPQV